VAREKKAIKEGFSSADQMIAHLEGQIKLGKGNKPWSNPNSVKPYVATTGESPCPTTKAPVSKTTSKSRPTIHVVDVLDSSGSMSGGKHSAAKKGINMGVGGLKADTANVNYTYTLCDFSDDLIFRHVKSQLSEVKEFKGNTRGSTALFDAIGTTIEKIKTDGGTIKSTDKVLVNIYTDGQENASRHFTATAIDSLIKSLSEVGWTFTFIGTASDVAYAQRVLSIKDSNTLVHDNTARGLEKSFVANTAARTSYSSKVSAGEDVSEGFYKDIN